MIRLSTLRRAIHPSLRGSLFYLSFFLSTGAYGPFLNVYYRGLGFSGQQIGFLATIYPLMTLLFAPLLSALADRRNWRIQILQGAIFVGAFFIFLLKFPTSFFWMAIVLLFMAIAYSPLMSIADSLVVNMAKRHALNYGGMRLWGSIGFAVSSILFGWVYQHAQLASMFTISALLMAPVFLITSTLEETPAAQNDQPQPISVIVKEIGLVILIGVSFLMGISNALTMSFEGILVQHLGGSNFMVGFTIGIAGVSEITTMQYGQKIADRIRKVNALILSIGLLFLAYIGYMVAAQPWMMVPAALLRGLGFGLFFTNIVRLVNDRVPEEWVSTAQSLRAVSMFGVAPLLAGPLGGLVHDRVSPSAVFAIGVISLGLAGVLLGWAAIKRIFN